MRYGYIAIEGNIGAGKTSLATRFADEYGGKLVLEEFADNPFLPKFYESPERYAFPLELSFVSERFSQLKNELNSRDLFNSFVIADYFISKSMIFSKANLSDDEYRLFMNMFRLIESNLPKPDLLVYLHQDVDQLQKNIRKRGRPYEQKIQDAYLEKIQKSYFQFLNRQKKMRIVIVDVSDMDFVVNDHDYDRLKEIVNGSWPLGVSRV